MHALRQCLRPRISIFVTLAAVTFSPPISQYSASNIMSRLTSPRAAVQPAAEELHHALDAPDGLEDVEEIVAEPSAQPTPSCEVNAAQKESPPVPRVPPAAMQRTASVNIAKVAASPRGIPARRQLTQMPTAGLLRRQGTMKVARLERFHERHGIATAMELQRQTTQNRARILKSQAKQQAFWERVPVLLPAKHPLLGRWDALTTLALIYVRERRSSRRPYTRG